MRYSITSNFKNLSINWGKWNFEPIVNSAHTAELLTLTKALNKYMDYLMYYPRRQHAK